jgi:hypothetical protein
MPEKTRQELTEFVLKVMRMLNEEGFTKQDGIFIVALLQSFNNYILDK